MAKKTAPAILRVKTLTSSRDLANEARLRAFKRIIERDRQRRIRREEEEYAKKYPITVAHSKNRKYVKDEKNPTYTLQFLKARGILTQAERRRVLRENEKNRQRRRQFEIDNILDELQDDGYESPQRLVLDDDDEEEEKAEVIQPVIPEEKKKKEKGKDRVTQKKPVEPIPSVTVNREILDGGDFGDAFEFSFRAGTLNNNKKEAYRLKKLREAHVHREMQYKYQMLARPNAMRYHDQRLVTRDEEEAWLRKYRPEIWEMKEAARKEKEKEDDELKDLLQELEKPLAEEEEEVEAPVASSSNVPTSSNALVVVPNRGQKRKSQEMTNAIPSFVPSEEMLKRGRRLWDMRMVQPRTIPFPLSRRNERKLLSNPLAILPPPGPPPVEVSSNVATSSNALVVVPNREQQRKPPVNTMAHEEYKDQESRDMVRELMTEFDQPVMEADDNEAAEYAEVIRSVMLEEQKKAKGKDRVIQKEPEIKDRRKEEKARRRDLVQKFREEGDETLAKETKKWMKEEDKRRKEEDKRRKEEEKKRKEEQLFLKEQTMKSNKPRQERKKKTNEERRHRTVAKKRSESSNILQGNSNMEGDDSDNEIREFTPPPPNTPPPPPPPPDDDDDPEDGLMIDDFAGDDWHRASKMYRKMKNKINVIVQEIMSDKKRNPKYTERQLRDGPYPDMSKWMKAVDERIGEWWFHKRNTIDKDLLRRYLWFRDAELGIAHTQDEKHGYTGIQRNLIDPVANVPGSGYILRRAGSTFLNRPLQWHVARRIVGYFAHRNPVTNEMIFMPTVEYDPVSNQYYEGMRKLRSKHDGKDDDPVTVFNSQTWQNITADFAAIRRDGPVVTNTVYDADADETLSSDEDIDYELRNIPPDVQRTGLFLSADEANTGRSRVSLLTEAKYGEKKPVYGLVKPERTAAADNVHPDVSHEEEKEEEKEEEEEDEDEEVEELSQIIDEDDDGYFDWKDEEIEEQVRALKQFAQNGGTMNEIFDFITSLALTRRSIMKKYDHGDKNRIKFLTYEDRRQMFIYLNNMKKEYERKFDPMTRWKYFDKTLETYSDEFWDKFMLDVENQVSQPEAFEVLNEISAGTKRNAQQQQFVEMIRERYTEIYDLMKENNPREEEEGEEEEVVNPPVQPEDPPIDNVILPDILPRRETVLDDVVPEPPPPHVNVQERKKKTSPYPYTPVEPVSHRTRGAKDRSTEEYMKKYGAPEPKFKPLTKKEQEKLSLAIFERLIDRVHNWYRDNLPPHVFLKNMDELKKENHWKYLNEDHHRRLDAVILNMEMQYIDLQTVERRKSKATTAIVSSSPVSVNQNDVVNDPRTSATMGVNGATSSNYQPVVVDRVEADGEDQHSNASQHGSLHMITSDEEDDDTQNPPNPPNQPNPFHFEEFAQRPEQEVFDDGYSDHVSMENEDDALDLDTRSPSVPTFGQTARNIQNPAQARLAGVFAPMRVALQGVPGRVNASNFRERTALLFGAGHGRMLRPKFF